MYSYQHIKKAVYDICERRGVGNLVLRMKNKAVKARRINNPDLLKLNWMEEFTGEQKAKQEPDILPSQPEDAVVFFNTCTITQVRKEELTLSWLVF